MGSNCGEDSNLSGVDGSGAHEEKILVSVRLRPLNEREVSQNDESDWECINNTIISKSHERAMNSTGYKFDRVFGSEISTRRVYEEGAKNVALSALNGINASIFAYGQTSSGKTYTMSGITEYTLLDIFNHVNKHESREFVLKFSALEIYNECVRDLLTSENTNLRLLDDPERGTVVEKLTEVTLRDWNQLKELLAVCEAQRQIGETTLNEVSSRSHQILRLTIESSTREYSTSHDSDILTATVNFVDLAGSERSSQSMSESTRLKEGCHINRSLLTLGTVIRKLSKGRNGHVPYRDSKLTRILQNSLGGNAKTAIICTLSPAQTHVEQSRNTLLFASCAKQVTNSAQVNVVMSEKALVKLLQKELARLEKELRRLASRSSGSCDSLSALHEKERLIEKMDNEIRELTQQRDHAHSRLQNEQLAEQSNLSHSFHEKGRAWLDDYPTSVSDINDSFQSEIASSASRSSDRYEGISSSKIGEFESEVSFLSDDMSPTKFMNKYFGPDQSVGWENIANTSDLITEDICKEVQHVGVEGDEYHLKSEEIPSQQVLNAIEVDNSGTSKIEAQDLKNTTDCLDIPISPLSIKDMSNSRSNDIARSRSCEASITIVSLEATKDHENLLQNGFEEETPEMVAEADNLKVVDELNQDSEKLEEDREDKTETSNEENIDEHNDYSTTFREDDDLKDEKGEDNSENTLFPSTDEKLECLQHDENFVGNLECQKQSVDNIVSDASSNEDENRECQKQIVDNHASEDKKHDCHKQIVDNHVSDASSNEDKSCISHKQIVDNHAGEDENIDYGKQIVDNHVNVSTTEDENLECQEDVVEEHVNEDENLDCHKQNVDKHISEDEILECHNQIVENHVNEENLDCHKQVADKQISEDEILECRKPSVDNNATQDENHQCRSQIVDNPLGVVSSPDHENLQRENHLGDNPPSAVVSSINRDNFQCDEEKSKANQVVKIEPTSEKQQNLPDNDSKVVDSSQLLSSNKSMDFEKQRQEIIELWNVCHVLLEHRTYFFLLFTGEPSDSIYMEVEQRRLSYLRCSLCQSSVASSKRTLQREREKLKRQMLKKLSSNERESLYEKWGIALKSKKRRLQLSRRLWTSTKDFEHIRESAALVAKLVGFEEANHAPKEIFGLSLPPPTICRSSTWQGLPSLLRQLDFM